MSAQQRHPYPNTGDELIDEVRGLRRELCEQFGNDVDRLFDHLREIEGEYAARRGVFSGVSKDAAAKVAESWGDLSVGADDAIVDEVRAIRAGLGQAQS